jgi:hypothetical protein
VWPYRELWAAIVFLVPVAAWIGRTRIEVLERR